jgi:hypothetical protein
MRVITVTVLVGMTVSLSALQPPSLDEVLARAGRYITAFEDRYAGIVAEERYEQRIPATQRVTPGAYGNLGTLVPDERRVLRSDFLVVKGKSGDWIPFRDVFEVDGKAVRDREDRLVALFIKPSESSVGQATRIAEDSTRFNLGEVKRTINVPTLVLMMLRPDRAKGFEYRRRDNDRIDGHATWQIDFRETARPTFIRTPEYRDLPVSGRIWVDPISGVIHRTTVTAEETHVTAKVTVAFRHEAKMEMLVPFEMEESYEVGSRKIHGKASYVNYRRFQVSTSESVGKPPGR